MIGVCTGLFLGTEYHVKPAVYHLKTFISTYFPKKD